MSLTKLAIETSKGLYQFLSAEGERFYYNTKTSILNQQTHRDAVLAKVRANVASRVAQAHRELNKQGKLRIHFTGPINNWEVALPRVLGEMGELSTCTWPATPFFASAQEWRDYRSKLNERMRFEFSQIAALGPPHLVVGYVADFNTEPETLELYKAAGSIVVNICFDDKLYFSRVVHNQYVGVKRLAPTVDLNLTNAPDSIAKYIGSKALAVFWPEAAEVLPPVESAGVHLGFKHDILFVGSRYGLRGRFVDRLIQKGFNVAAFGKGWPAGTVDQDDLNQLYQTSRIVLGFSTVGYSSHLYCLKGRDFEVPMAGGLYLTQHNPELALVYKIGDEIETFTSFTDCCQKITFLLNHPETAANIRQAGARRALNEHTWKTRFTQVLHDVGLQP